MLYCALPGLGPVLGWVWPCTSATFSHSNGDLNTICNCTMSAVKMLIYTTLQCLGFTSSLVNLQPFEITLAVWSVRLPSPHKVSQDKRKKIPLQFVRKSLLWHNTSRPTPGQMLECLDRENFILHHKLNNWEIKKQLRKKGLRSSRHQARTDCLIRRGWLHYALPTAEQLTQHKIITPNRLLWKKTASFCYCILSRWLWHFEFTQVTPRKNPWQTNTAFIFLFLFKETNVKNSVTVACRHLSSLQLQLKRITAAI